MSNGPAQTPDAYPGESAPAIRVSMIKSVLTDIHLWIPVAVLAVGVVILILVS